ncbi:MAG: glycosyltransferase family 4 protein [Bacteroidota bacterium]
MIEMVNRGYNITVVAVWGGEKDKITNHHFKVIYLKPKIKWISFFYLIVKNPIKSIKHLQLLKEYLGRRDSLRFFSSYPDLKLDKADHIHAHFANNAALKGYLFSKFLDIPFSCTGHGSELLLYPEPYLKTLIQSARPFITISEYNKAILNTRYNLRSDEIIVNYCGVDTEYFQRSGHPYPDEFIIISVTALRDIKGVQYLIEACNILKSQIHNFQCIIIGSGKDYESLKELIFNNGLGRKVHLLGAVAPENIRNYLLKASVFVLPSLSEGIPIAVMEAMAMELPVIASDITGLPEIIENGKNGFLFPPFNIKALSDKIIELYQNPELTKEFGKKARNTIIEKFNLTKNVSHFIELLNSED